MNIYEPWHDIVAVEIVGDYKLHLTFDDGMVRELDMADQLWGKVFEPLKDPALFAQVKIDPEMGYLFWPTGADLNNFALYQGRPPLCSVEVARAPRRAA